MLKIRIGRAKTGKSEQILKEIAELGDHSRQILLVPEHASYAAELDLCHACGDGASRHAEVLSFSRLATRVLSATGGMTDVTLDGGGKLLMLQRALCEVAPALKIYHGFSRKSAFSEELLALIDEFQSYEVSPEVLAERAEEMTGATRDKLRDLSLIYGAYEARLHRPGQDLRDRMSKLCDCLEESHYIDGTDLFLDGFTYFNAQEQRVLSVFLQKARSVTVALLGDRTGRPELFDTSYRTRDQLIRLAGEVCCSCTVEYSAEPVDAAPLSHLERCFFGESMPWEEETKAIRIREAETIFSETEQAASDIRRLVASGKCRYREIAVTARNMGEYESTIECVFERFGIPVYLSRRRDILQTPALTLITGVLKAVTGGYEYEDMFQYLKTGLAGLTPQECDRLENYVLTWEIHGSMWLKDTPWSANPDGYNAPWGDAQRETLTDINQLRQRVQLPLSELAHGMNSLKTARDKVRILYIYMERIHLQQSLECQIKSLSDAGQMQMAEETAQLWGILCDVLDQIVEILGDEKMDTDEFSRLLRQVLTQYSIGTIPVSLDQVTASEMTRNDRHTVRYLFLLGANDHVLPPSEAGGGILNDDDREELAYRGVRLAPRGMEQMNLELQNLYASLAQPTDGLIISYPITDVTGAELRPAFLIARIQALFPRVKPERERANREYRLTAPIPALEAAGEHSDGPVWKYFESIGTEFSRLDAMRRARDMGRGKLSRAAVRALYGERMYLSASRMEKLNSCHFAYFMEYGLKAKNRMTATFDAPQIGSFLHFLLENVTRDTMSMGGFTVVSNERLKELTEKYFQIYTEQQLPNFRNRSPRFRYLFRRLRSNAWSIIKEVAEEMRASDFVPLEFELSFGDHGVLPAATICGPGGELRVTGKVDRVDGWLKDGRLYLRVVDYKTGRKSFNFSEVLMGLNIQMLLYLFAIQEEGTRHFGHEIEPAGVLYLPARDDLLSAERGITPEQLNAMKKKNLRRSGLLLNQRDVLTAMEHSALTEPHYLPLRVNRSGDITDGVASAEQLGKLNTCMKQLLRRVMRELREGNVDADPWYRSEEESCCQFCEWQTACYFSDGCGRDHIRHLTPVSREDFWRQIDKDIGEEGD